MARGGSASPKQTPTDWVTRAADDALRHAAGEDRVITCSSGVSPSGPAASERIVSGPPWTTFQPSSRSP